jgi:hypothetical protein
MRGLRATLLLNVVGRPPIWSLLAKLAAMLDMSVRTAESHHASILAKLGIDSPGELVRIAIRDGLI